MELLGRHVRRAADHGRAVRRDLEVARRAEVADLQHPVFGDEHVAGPEVAVQDADAVRMVDGVADLAAEVERPGEVEHTLLDDEMLQRLARHVLHHDEKHIVLSLGREDADDVRDGSWRQAGAPP